ncbi:MAG: zf-HC2 domain-containing protein [Actinobacteria bacterium]|nr:zf-HC2 domain-containing protein [Actinomycetota bacterium]
MHCKACRDLLDDYVDGLPCADEVGAVSKHLADCLGCRSEYEALTKVIEALETTPRVVAPAGFAEMIMAAVGLEKPHAAAGRATDRRWAAAGVAAIIAVVNVLAFVLLSHPLAEAILAPVATLASAIWRATASNWYFANNLFTSTANLMAVLRTIAGAVSSGQNAGWQATVNLAFLLGALSIVLRKRGFRGFSVFI